MEIEQLNLFSEMEEIELAEDDPNTRVCRACGERKVIEQFQISATNHGGRKYLCRTCRNHREVVLRYLKKKHKYPDETYECPICGVTKWEQRNDKPIITWTLDHCHKTDQFRGWLCPRCNTGIGQLEDNVDILKKGLEYLQQHENKGKE